MPDAEERPPARRSQVPKIWCPYAPRGATPDFFISNRRWLARLENAATCTKRSSGAFSNRHIWGPISPEGRVEFMAHT